MDRADATTPPGSAASGTRPGDPAALDDAGPALFRLGRLFSKPPSPQALTARTGRAIELSRILVVQAIEAGPGEAEREMTVGTVAVRLGIDPSTASRLVAEAIKDGYLSRATSRADARRAHLELTDAGRALAASARRYQRAVFEQVTRDWTDAERREFARLFVRVAAAVAETLADPPPASGS